MPRVKDISGSNCAMRRIAYISLLLTAGCNLASEADYDETPDEARLSIAGLKTLCSGRTSIVISRDAIIRGQVVANDLYGEFDREIVIQDSSGGISVAIEDGLLAERFPFGIQIDIRCNGLSLCDYGGKIQLGAAPGAYGCTPIPAGEIDRHVRVTSRSEAMPRARDLTFGEVRSEHIDTRVRFCGVRFADPGKTWCDTDPETGQTLTTERQIIDPAGNRFPVRTDRACDYAIEVLPAGTGSLIGVIDYFGGKFSLRVTFHELEFRNGLLPATDEKAPQEPLRRRK